MLFFSVIIRNFHDFIYLHLVNFVGKYKYIYISKLTIQYVFWYTPYLLLTVIAETIAKSLQLPLEEA